MTNKIKSNLKLVGWYQIIGGSIGVLLVAYSIIMAENVTGFALLVYAMALLLFGYSIFSGVLCVENKNAALQHTLINQILQILGFALLGFGFSYAAGLYINIGIDLTDGLNMTLGTGISKVELNINREHERISFSFNLVAIALVYWINTLRMKRNAEKARAVELEFS